MIVPHLEYAKPLLDRIYPPMAVPEAVDAGDPQHDADDPILVEGYRLAKELVKACEGQGRKRRLEAYGSSGGPGGGADNVDKYLLGTLTVVQDRSAGQHVVQLETTAIREHPWLASRSRTRPTVKGTTRHGSSPSQPQGAFKV